MGRVSTAALPVVKDTLRRLEAWDRITVGMIDSQILAMVLLIPSAFTVNMSRLGRFKEAGKRSSRFSNTTWTWRDRSRSPKICQTSLSNCRINGASWYAPVELCITESFVTAVSRGKASRATATISETVLRLLDLFLLTSLVMNRPKERSFFICESDIAMEPRSICRVFGRRERCG